jgi:hypothetical protein
MAMKAPRLWSSGSRRGGAWLNELLCASDSNAPLSVTETLARAMTERFIGEMRERAVQCLLRRAPPTIEKLAVAYRAQCRWIEQTIPSDLMILVDSVGAKDGKVKQACRSYMYWNVALEMHRLTSMTARIDAPKLAFLEYVIAISTQTCLRQFSGRLADITF